MENVLEVLKTRSLKPSPKSHPPFWGGSRKERLECGVFFLEPSKVRDGCAVE